MLKRFTLPLGSGARRSTRPAFTLVEMLVVLAIIGVLAALLFPVFLTARGKAREVVCVSNLHQVGLSVTIYADDNDGLYPYAVDPADKFTPQIWNSMPEFKNQIPYIGMIQDTLRPYAKSPNIFGCPADNGFDVEDFTGLEIDPEGKPKNAYPSSFKKFGTSYYYRTEIAVKHAGIASFQRPSEVNVLFDGAGRWHGSFFPPDLRYVVLFADGHSKNISRSQLDRFWAAPL